jgi:hypothetical protein
LCSYGVSFPKKRCVNCTPLKKTAQYKRLFPEGTAAFHAGDRRLFRQFFQE